jgi:hypothetical protein
MIIYTIVHCVLYNVYIAVAITEVLPLCWYYIVIERHVGVMCSVYWLVAVRPIAIAHTHRYTDARRGLRS